MPIPFSNPRTFGPFSGGKPEQIIVLLHGYGSNGDDLISLAPMLAQALPKALFISPDAPYRSEMGGFGFQWFSLIEYTIPAMMKGSREVAPMLNEFLENLLEQNKLPGRKMALVGFSQGTMMALQVGLRFKEPLAGIVGYSGALLDEEETLVNDLHHKTPVCLIHGEMDPVVPFAALQKATDTLKALSVDIESHARPFIPHTIDPEGIMIGTRFLKRVLGQN